MLPAASRLRRPIDFSRVVRRGRRAGRPLLVVHMFGPEPASAGSSGSAAGPRVGLVVGRPVGGAVVRNQVKRRLRHLVAERIERLPAGADLVIRVQPAASGASSAALGADLDRALDRVLA